MCVHRLIKNIPTKLAYNDFYAPASKGQGMLFYYCPFDLPPVYPSVRDKLQNYLSYDPQTCIWYESNFCPGMVFHKYIFFSFIKMFEITVVAVINFDDSVNLHYTEICYFLQMKRMTT